ncbi:unnamed protein product [Ectocarpus sp. CCAP 1310/34]|nr:unnamed protein product [Ectocarpus sp. CCAP 1310/34]
MATESSNSAVAVTLADPQYKAGRKLIDDGRLEEAVNFFSGLLETRVQVLSGDEMSPSLAPLYYEYGNSLLYNAEESGAVFGDAITDAEQKKRAMAIVEAQINGQAAAAAAAAGSGGAAREGANGGADGEGAAGQASTPDQEAEEDLELAWENLEMARRIYGGLELTEDIRTAIAKVHLRLGDLNMVNGMYNEAADEFEKCLDHRLALPCRHSRGVADAHVRRAQALFYASTLEGAETDALVERSLEQYRLAMGVFDAMLASLKETPEVTAAAAGPSPDAASPGKENSDAPNTSNGSGSPNGKGKGKGGAQGVASPPPTAASAIEELEDVRDAIRETIDTMVSGKDMEALAEYKRGTGTTTVGFGNPSPASAFSGGGGGGGGGSSSIGGVAATPAAGEVTTVGFRALQSGATTTAGFGGASAAGFSPAGAGGGAAANVMVVKRKGRPAPKPAAAAPPPVAGVGAEAIISPKKAKPNKE